MKKLIILAVFILDIVVGARAFHRPAPPVELKTPETISSAPMGYQLVPDEHSQGYGYIIPQLRPQPDVIVNTGQDQLKP